MSGTESPAPRRRLRRVGVVVAIALVIAAVLLIAFGRTSPQAPAEVWMPAATLDSMGEGAFHLSSLDVRTSPAGATLQGWRGHLSRSLQRKRPYLLVYPEAGWTEGVRLWIEGSIALKHWGGYADSGDRRDAGGTIWARMTWLDAEAFQRYSNDDE